MVIKKTKRNMEVFWGPCAQDRVVVAFVLANAPICRQTARVYADGCFPTGRLRCVAGSSRRSIGGQAMVPTFQTEDVL